MNSINPMIWIDPARLIVSFHPAPGFSPERFATQDQKLARLHILAQAGYRFQ